MRTNNFLFFARTILVITLAFGHSFVRAQSDTLPKEVLTLAEVKNLFANDDQKLGLALRYLNNTWVAGYIPFLLDAVYRARRIVNRDAVVGLLEKRTGQAFGADTDRWYEWMWNRDVELLPFHGEWMVEQYKKIDPKFERYFKGRTDQALIRLDEVRWGGVVQDGIPPLRQPKMTNAAAAYYLGNNDVVFGVSINGDHRAYPKRILAWHEMFVDEIGGEKITGVYCTLCGTVIAYNTTFEGRNYELGTSGFLYRSNKLMYDKATQSLWNTIEGKPVVGPLTRKEIELSSHAVVTTTWGEWKRLHPDTQVLSKNTGYRRDYNEGVAYQNYFATDELMFDVPVLDARLANKDEVLIVRTVGYQADPLAISAKFLKRKRVYHDEINDTKFVVFTDKTGGNRVYASEEVRFEKVKEKLATDSAGNEWQVEEGQLVATNGRVLPRLPYHRIFWFAWFNTYANTRLVK